MRKWPKYSIWYILAVSLLWLFWQLFLDELASLAREHIPEGGMIMYSVTHPYIIMPSLIILACLFILVRSKRKTKEELKLTPKSENLVDTLTMMHRRLVEIQKEKASRTKIRYRQWDKAMPALADKMGTIKLKDWSKFTKGVKQKIQRAAPRPNFRQKFSFKEWARYRERV